MTNATIKTLWGLELSLPFFLANLLVVSRLEPIYSFLWSIGILSAKPYPTVPILLSLGLIGSFIAASPMLPRANQGHWRFYTLNLIIALILLAFFGTVSFALGQEIYRCEMLNIPNCD